MYIYIYIYVCMYVCMYVCVYIVSLVVILSNWVCDNWVYQFSNSVGRFLLKTPGKQPIKQRPIKRCLMEWGDMCGLSNVRLL